VGCTLLVCALMFVLALAHLHGRPGRAWAAIRQSEPAATAAGVNVTLYKLLAFGLACFLTGVAGCLLAGSSGGLSVYQFAPQESISLLAVVLMAGMGTPWGAVLAGILMKGMPAVLDRLGVSSSFLLILFGAGLVQTMAMSPGGITGQLAHDLGRRRRRKPAERPDVTSGPAQDSDGITASSKPVAGMRAGDDAYEGRPAGSGTVQPPAVSSRQEAQ
jgi:branched-chain amino acid transport system permease protein